VRRYIKINGLLPALILLSGLFYCGVLLARQGAADLKKAYDHFWMDYAGAMKKIKAEKDDAAAAQQTDQLKKFILPGFSRVLASTAKWKQTHSKREVAELEAWVNSNPHAKEASDLQSDLMIRAARERGLFGKSFMEYLQMMAKAGK